MKRILICAILALIALSLPAQKYKVIDVEGTAVYYSKKEKLPIRKGMTLDAKTVVMLKYKSSLSLIEVKANGRNIKLTKVGKNTLQNMIKAENKGIADVGKDYIDYVHKKISGGDKVKKIHSDPATVTREIDSVKTDTERSVPLIPSKKDSRAQVRPDSL